MKRIADKLSANGTVNNCNSATSPGDTHSGRRRTQMTQANITAVKQVMDRDAQKVMLQIIDLDLFCP